MPLLHAFGRLGRSMEGPLKVLDVGGSFGNYRHVLADVCPKLELDWTVAETPSTAAVFADLEQPNLRWRDAMTDALGEANSYDVSFICGTLQYLTDPHTALQKFIRLSRFCILGRLPVVEHAQDHCFLQYMSTNAAMPASPNRFFSRPMIMQTLMSEANVRSFFLDIPATPLRTEVATPSYYTILAENRSYQGRS